MLQITHNQMAMFQIKLEDLITKHLHITIWDFEIAGVYDGFQNISDEPVSF